VHCWLTAATLQPVTGLFLTTAGTTEWCTSVYHHNGGKPARKGATNIFLCNGVKSPLEMVLVDFPTDKLVLLLRALVAKCDKHVRSYNCSLEMLTRDKSKVLDKNGYEGRAPPIVLGSSDGLNVRSLLAALRDVGFGTDDKFSQVCMHTVFFGKRLPMNGPDAAAIHGPLLASHDVKRRLHFAASSDKRFTGGVPIKCHSVALDLTKLAAARRTTGDLTDFDEEEPNCFNVPNEYFADAEEEGLEEEAAGEEDQPSLKPGMCIATTKIETDRGIKGTLTEYTNVGTGFLAMDSLKGFQFKFEAGGKLDDAPNFGGVDSLRLTSSTSYFAGVHTMKGHKLEVSMEQVRQPLDPGVNGPQIGAAIKAIENDLMYIQDTATEILNIQIS